MKHSKKKGCCKNGNSFSSIGSNTHYLEGQVQIVQNQWKQERLVQEAKKQEAKVAQERATAEAKKPEIKPERVPLTEEHFRNAQKELGWAIESNDSHGIRAAVAKGADVNKPVPTWSGTELPLERAIGRHLSTGGRPENADWDLDYVPPRAMAAFEELIKLGADIHVKVGDGTILNYSLGTNARNLVAAKRLVELGADPRGIEWRMNYWKTNGGIRSFQQQLKELEAALKAKQVGEALKA